MLWMVHRAFLDDPEMTELDFSHCHLPLPHDEPRVAPKLIQSLAHNTTIKKVNLNNTNLQNPQGMELAEALRTNTTLLDINLESNCLTSTSIKEMADSIKESPDCSLETWRFAMQMGQDYFGRPTEQALAEMLETNTKILKLGVNMSDPHWRAKVDQFITRNQDQARRDRKAKSGKVDVVEKIAPKDKQLGKVLLEIPPDAAAYDIYEDDNEKITLLRKTLAANKKMPTKEQLQGYAKKEGIALKFAEVAPLLVEFRQKLLDAFVEKKIKVCDPFGTETEGTLSAWTVKNEKWLLDMWPDAQNRFYFKAESKPPSLEVSDAVAQWLYAGSE